MATPQDAKKVTGDENNMNSSAQYENGCTQYETLAPENLRSTAVYEQYGSQPVTYERLDEKCRQSDGGYNTCKNVSTEYQTLTQEGLRDNNRAYEKLNVNKSDIYTDNIPKPHQDNVPKPHQDNVPKPHQDTVRRRNRRLCLIVAVLIIILAGGGVATAVYFIASGSEVDGSYSTWSEWSACTVTCGGANQTRMRNCSNPTDSDCEGINHQERICNNISCPVNGGLTMWSTWSACTVTCDGGIKTRTRACSNPTPAFAGTDCDGVLLQEQWCNNSSCSGIQGDCWTGNQCASCNNGYVGSINGVSVCCQKCEKSGLMLGPRYCLCAHNGP